MITPVKPLPFQERAMHTYTLSLWIQLAGILLLALLWFATIRIVQQDHDDELQAAFQTQATLARAMDLPVPEVLDDADGVLLAMKYSQEYRGNITAELRQVLEMPNLAKFTSQASILDTKGEFLFSFRPVQPAVNLADRAQFRAHVERDTGMFYISPVVQGRVSGVQSFHISRRINNPDGSFGGVVSLALQTRYFTENGPFLKKSGRTRCRENMSESAPSRKSRRSSRIGRWGPTRCMWWWRPTRRRSWRGIGCGVNSISARPR